MRIINKSIAITLTFFLSSSSVLATSHNDRKKEKMVQDLEVIKHLFEVSYAPAAWKKEHFGWDLTEEFEKAKRQVIQTDNISTKEFQRIVKAFIRSFKDHHVTVSFFSTECATLPFTVKSTEGRVFVDWADPLRLPPTQYSLQAGDELIRFDGRPVYEVIDELEEENGRSCNPFTDRSLADASLTCREGKAGDKVPKGTITLTTRSSQTGDILTHQLRWQYTPEVIANAMDFLETIPTFLPKTKEKLLRHPFADISMRQPVRREMLTGDGREKVDSPLPPFGEVIWSVHDNEENQEDFWNAYIYRLPTGSSVGVIRIPDYSLDASLIERFGKIIATMQEKADALIIDQLNNPGGSLNSLYSIVAMLTDKPLRAPYHRFKITQKDAMQAYRVITKIEDYEKLFQYYEERGRIDRTPVDEDGDDINYQELLFLKAWWEVILEEWKNGKSLTRPTPALGADYINPHHKYRYTKPLVILTNELDFSCADFMAAIMQDNSRAILFGQRTAGAGGSVKKYQFPNQHGIDTLSYTASLAERADKSLLEGLGVTPDIECPVTPYDLVNGYADYIAMINTMMEILTKTDSVSD